MRSLMVIVNHRSECVQGAVVTAARDFAQHEFIFLLRARSKEKGLTVGPRYLRRPVLKSSTLDQNGTFYYLRKIYATYGDGAVRIQKRAIGSNEK